MESRYARQEAWSGIGAEGQEQIRQKHVLIVGCGALGAANAETLTRAGVGKLSLVDRDYVEYTNLQRQQLFTEADAAQAIPKAIAARKHLQAINSDVSVQAHVMEATKQTLPSLLHDVDVVIDATDNFDTRYVLNDILLQRNIPWIFGSCACSAGMSYTILPGQTPCFHCLFKQAEGGATCDKEGIIGPAVQMTAAHQTAEALKLLVGAKSVLRSTMMIFDLWSNHYSQVDMQAARQESCPSCGKQPTYPALRRDALQAAALCGRDTVLIRRHPVDLEVLETVLPDISVKNEHLIVAGYAQMRFVFFSDGRTLVHGTDSVAEAKRLYYQLVG